MAPDVKKALVLMLVIVVIVTGLPLLMTMPAMSVCPDCGPALLAGGATCALAVLAAGAAMLLVMIGHRLLILDTDTRLRLHAFVLERPPQLA